MASDKRDLSDLLKYEGSINKGENIYSFPTLYKKTKTGKTRIWNIYVRLIKNPKKRNKDIDWNVLKDDELSLKKEYISGEQSLPPNSVGQYWVVSGEIDGKKTRHSPSYGKAVNIGKKDERNSLQTAIIYARNEFLKKINRGFKENIADIDILKKELKHARYYPMKAAKYTEKYDKITYPCYVQPKLDGTRVVAYLHKKKETDDVVLYTRQLKDVPGKDYIRDQLKPILEKMYDNKDDESLYIDFEFYKFGLKLQDISGTLRNEKDTSKSIQCWIFDAFYPTGLSNMEFAKRWELVNIIFEKDKTPENKRTSLDFKFNREKILDSYRKWLHSLQKEYNHASVEKKKKMFKKEKGIASLEAAEKLYKELEELNASHLDKFSVPIQNHIAKVPTIMANNRVEEEYIYRGFITLGFEGSIVRNMAGLYRASAITDDSWLRSPDVQKRKPVFSDEYEIVNYTEGMKGKERGAILWILKTKEGKEFTVAPKNVSIKERKELYNKFKKDSHLFDKDYNGKMITIEFEDKSKDNVPQRAKALGLRPYK